MAARARARDYVATLTSRRGRPDARAAASDGVTPLTRRHHRRLRSAMRALLLLLLAQPLCPADGSGAAVHDGAIRNGAGGTTFQFAVDLANITADAAKGLVGAALEDINFSLYPGLYSQLVFGESFEESHIQGMALPKGDSTWAGCAADPACHATWAVSAVGYNRSARAIDIDSSKPHTGKQALSLRCLAAPCGEQIGVSQMGLHRWGLALTAGETLEGTLFVRSGGTPGGSLTASLCPSHTDGTPLPAVQDCYATASLEPATTDGWSPRHFRLTPSKTDANASLVLRLSGGSVGSVTIDDVLLEPAAEQRWKPGHHVRKDMADAMLLDGGLGFVRFGGDMADAQSYDWRNQRGPVGERP